MKTKYLDVVTDRATGELGLIVRGVRLMDYPMAAGGMQAGRLIAHDITEHVNGLKKIGSVDDELEALGAIIYGRIDCGLIEAGALKYDVSELARCYAEGVDFKTPVPRTKRLDEYVEEIILKSVRKGLHYVAEELGESDMPATYHKRLLEFRQAAPHYLRRGWRKACKKYKASYELVDMFTHIEKVVNRISNHIDHEGQVFKLTSRDNYNFYCEEVFEDEY